MPGSADGSGGEKDDGRHAEMAGTVLGLSVSWIGIGKFRCLWVSTVGAAVSAARKCLVNNLSPPPPFFVSADSEGVTQLFFGSADLKGVRGLDGDFGKKRSNDATT